MNRTLCSVAFACLLAIAGCRTDKDLADSAAAAGGASGGNSATNPSGLIADAGDDQTLPADGGVQLDGTGSYNPDGGSMTYHWAFEHVPEGSALDAAEQPLSPNNAEDASEPSFMPDVVGTYVLSLYVTDGDSASETDYVTITADEPEDKPVADAGEDLSSEIGLAVNLDGTDSYDELGRALTYEWTVAQTPDGSAVSGVLNNTASVSTFTPDMKGYYTFSLTVNNGLTDSDPDSVVVTAFGDDDEAPVANAGSDFGFEDCSWVPLDGSGSADPNGDALTYYWDVQSVPDGSSVTIASISDQNAERSSFYADVDGTYVLSLTVSDGDNWSVPDEVSITIIDRTYNSLPVIDTGLKAGQALVLSAGNAECEETAYGYECDDCDEIGGTIGDTFTITDPDGDEYTVLWEVLEGDVEITTPDSLITTATFDGAAAETPGECASTYFKLNLTVTDCTGESSSALLDVVVECCGEKPKEKKKKKKKKKAP